MNKLIYFLNKIDEKAYKMAKDTIKELKWE